MATSRAICVYCGFANVIALVIGQAASPPRTAVESAHGAIMLLWIAIVLIFVVLGGLSILRMLRRARERHLRKRQEPTDATDVWQMHKLPGDTDADSDCQSGS